MPVLQEGRSPSPVNFLAIFGGADALRRDGTTQERGAQPVVRRQEMRAAPRDPPTTTTSAAQWGEAGLDWIDLESHHLSKVRTWWRGTFVVSMCGLRAEPSGSSSRNIEQKLILLCSEGKCV